VQEILRMYAIPDFQCEHHCQHRNPAECQIQEVKKLSIHLLDWGSKDEFHRHVEYTGKSSTSIKPLHGPKHM
jgi:hypothetical protein